MARFFVRTLADLGAALTLAPERHLAAGMGEAAGVAFSTLVVERNERVSGAALTGAVVLDTTHAKDGILDVRSALRAGGTSSSAKKRVYPGDLLISRLRPYLRQIALAHPAALDACGAKIVACSTEFYVLAPSEAGASLAYLIPHFLGADVQALLAAGQEGGHHPRVPRETLLGVKIPHKIIRSRRLVGERVLHALDGMYAAGQAYAQAVEV